MKDEDKTKEQLIAELNQLRKQVRFYKNALDQLPGCTIAYDETNSRNNGCDDEQMINLSRKEYFNQLPIKPGTPDISNYILKLKQVEQTLREQLFFVQRLIDNIPNPIFYKDAEGVFLGCNKAFKKFLGLRGEKIIGKTVYDVYPKDLADKFCQMDSILFTEPGVQVYETPFPHTDGTRHNVILNKATYLNNDGHIAGLVGVVIDINRRKKTEEALRLSEERFSKVFDASPVMKMVISFSTEEIILANDSFLRHTGYSRPEVVGHKLAKLNIWADTGQIEQLKKIVKKQGFVNNFETGLRTHSGELRTVLTCIDTIELNNEKCLLIAASDITERKQFEKEMARLDRLNLIGEMAAALGHEVRNPITTVRGFLQLLGSKKELSSYQEYFNLMIDELDRTGSIINEFLSLAKNKPIELKKQSLNHILTLMFPLIQSDSAKAGQSVHLALGDIPALLLDEKEIRQLILNLVRNGLEAMPPGGRLTIETFTNNTEVVLAVKDQGCGIPPEVLGKIGTPFFTTKETGTGLGMAVCYSIAARHKAKIDIETSPAGTTFLVKFKKRKE